MSDRSKLAEVASGSPYTVTAVNDQPPAALDDFVARSVVALVVARTSDDQVVEIHGSARRDHDSVIVYEKDGGGVGKDVRTWQVTMHDDGFEAIERSRF